MIKRSVVGRLAPNRWQAGDPLPEIGSLCLVSGANCDVESDQHRSYMWRKIVGYGEGDMFICLQTEGCWPTVERTENCWFAEIPTPRNIALRAQADAGPVNMVLHCPSCGLQHIDHAESAVEHEHGAVEFEAWDNPPHRSHLCHGCGHIWRPADVPTNGVLAVKTKGKNDSPIAEQLKDERGIPMEVLRVTYAPDLSLEEFVRLWPEFRTWQQDKLQVEPAPLRPFQHRCESCGKTYMAKRSLGSCVGCRNEAQQAEPVGDERFFMEHGLWHDCLTGQHMYTQDQYDELRREAFHEGYASRNDELAAQSGQRAGVAEGWCFYSADFSMNASNPANWGTVMLTRDDAGRKWWHALSDEEREKIDLFVSGRGTTFDAAMKSANEKAAAAPTPAAQGGDR